MTKRERDLERRGYRFSGHYFRYGEKAAAKAKAAEYRATGSKAQVVTTVSRGRVYSSEGYSVYVKEPCEGSR